MDHRDKPRKRLLSYLNTAADVIVGGHAAGLSDEVIARILIDGAGLGANPNPAIPPGDGPEWGWRDGRWTRLEPEPEHDEDMP